MKNSSLFTRIIATSLCAVLLVGTLLMGMVGGFNYEFDSDFNVTPNVTPNTNPSTTKPTTTLPATTVKPNTTTKPSYYPPKPDDSFSMSTELEEGALMLGTLANDLIIGTADGVNAILPADVKIAEGASSVALSVKPVETGSEIELGAGETAQSLDVHIEGVALDNTVPMIVNLGAILDAGFADTEIKFYHTENGVAVPMTRVNSLSDFAIHNQYYYNAETGEVSIYVASFSVFSAVQANVDEWDGSYDFKWYNADDTKFVIDSAEEFAGFRAIVDGGYYEVVDGEWTWNEVTQDAFVGKTVELGVDIDLKNILFDPIGFGYTYNKDSDTAFMGTFDGAGHTVYNLYQNGWDLDPDKTNYGTFTYSTAGGGLFASIENAIIKNLVVSGADIVFECVDMGIVVGYAQGDCHFENIFVTNSKIANYNRATGGVVGEVCYGSYGTDTTKGYSHTFENIVVDSSVKVSSLWGSFDTLCGGVIGGKWGDATVYMKDVVVAVELDVFSDVTAAYEWYAYRRCGMLIGHTEQNSPKKATNAAAEFLKCENVFVYYGDWVNYSYCQFTNYRYPWARVQAGEHHTAYTNPRHSTAVDANGKLVEDDNHTHKDGEGHNLTIKFDQLYGGGQGVYGCNDHKGGGVKVVEKLTTTVYFQNTNNWENPTLYYWYTNGNSKWSTIVDGIALEKVGNDGLHDIYRIDLPEYVGYIGGFTVSGTNNSTQLIETTPEITHDKIVEGHVYIANEGSVNHCVYKDGHNTIYLENSKGWTSVDYYSGNTFLYTVELNGTDSVYNLTVPAYVTSLHLGDKTLDTTNLVAGNVYLLVGSTFNSCKYIEGSKTVYFYNNASWTNVSLYYWFKDSKGKAWDTLGFPGEKMTLSIKDGNYDIYEFVIPSYAEAFVISNGIKAGVSGHKQTVDISVDSCDGKIYDIGTATTTGGTTYNVGTSTYAEGYKTIYLKNNYRWDEVQAYYNIGAAWVQSSTVKLLGYDGTYEYYSIQIPNFAVKFNISGEKNDGNGSRQQIQDQKLSDYTTYNMVTPSSGDGNNVTVTKSTYASNAKTTYMQLYFKPSSSWYEANARFAVYAFKDTSTNEWYNLTDKYSGGIYKVWVSTTYNQVILCRMSPNSSNNWNNKWTQTADLKIPTNGNNLFTLSTSAGTDGNTKYTGTWSKK